MDEVYCEWLCLIMVVDCVVLLCCVVELYCECCEELVDIFVCEMGKFCEVVFGEVDFVVDIVEYYVD